MAKKENFEVAEVINATPEDIYDAWLSSDGHAAMTGGRKAVVESGIGGTFSVHEGQITGRNVELKRPTRIVQNWRSPAFADTDEDSRIEVSFEPVDGGTKVTIQHSNIPAGQADHYLSGWNEYYFKPMKAHFA